MENQLFFLFIETALKSKLFSKIHISTESKKIVNIIKKKIYILISIDQKIYLEIK